MMIDELIRLMNLLSDLWVPWVIAGLLETSALLMLVSLVWMAIRHHVSPQVGYCLFLLVPLKLLLPFSVTVPAGVAYLLPWIDVSSQIESQDDAQQSAIPQFAEQPRNSSLQREITEPNFDIAAATVGPRAADALPDTSNHLNLENADTIATAANAIAPSADLIRAHLSMTAYAMLVWLSSVSFLLGRFFLAQLRFRKQLNRLKPLEESQLGFDFRELCRRQKISREVRVIVSDDISVPAVWGIIRPIIILPRAVLSTLSSHQLQWVILHELAHIRRADLGIVACQRIVAAVHFFNPSIWIANRMIHRLREYACDDLAILRSDGSAIDSGEAFLLILRQANKQPHRLNGALGVFGLDSRAVCFARVHRLMDTDRRIRTGLDTLSLCGLLVLASITLPHIQAAQEEQKSDAQRQVDQSNPPADTKSEIPKLEQDRPTAAVALAKDTGRFELTVVDHAGKPIPEAAVEIRLNPAPTPIQLQEGQLIKTEGKSALALTSSLGRLTLTHPKSSIGVDVRIMTPGYGAYRATWSAESESQQIPAKFQAELDTGWTVGGTIVDENGNAIPGARIEARTAFKNPAGISSRTLVGAIATTDQAGKWRFESAAEPVGLHVDIDHPDFMPRDDVYARRDSRTEHGREVAEKTIQLQRGLTVTGKVTDDAGTPIERARVFARVASYHIREVMTDADGTYRLPGCAANISRIVVFAEGRAPEATDVSVEPAMEAVNFQLKVGAKLRVRILDETGRPIPKAHLIFRGWRGTSFGYFEFDKVNRYADEQGVWEWTSAPTDEFRADICRPNGLCLANQTLKAGADEYVFRVPLELVVVGNVVDAETKEPIKSFVVTTGNRFQNGATAPKDRLIIGRANGNNGRYRIVQTEGDQARRNVNWIQVESDGYRSSDWRDVKFDLAGTASVNFEIARAQPTAVTSTDKPGADAQAIPSHPTTTETKTAISLPMECVAALKRNVDALQTCTLTYSQHRQQPPLPEGTRDDRPTRGVDGYTVLDPGRLYHRKIFSHRPSRARLDGTPRPNYEEYAFDGQIFYLGSPGLGRGHVTKYLGENPDKKEAQALGVQVYYLEAAGFQVPRSFADWKTSSLESSILKATTEGLILKLTEDASVLTLEMKIPDQTVLMTRNMDLEMMKQQAEKMERQEFKDNQLKLIELYRKVAAREPWRKAVIKLDRQKGYALQHQTDYTLDGDRIQSIDCEEFEHFAQQQIWLPRRCIQREYTQSPFFLQDFTDEPTMTTQIKLDSVEFTKPDDVKFAIDYGPGSRVTDRTRPSSVSPEQE